MKFEVSSNKIFSFIGSNKEEIHPFWLRERVSEKEYLDEGTQQRLFDPSSMKQTVEIVNAEINGEFLKVKFNDGVDSKFEIKKLPEGAKPLQEWADYCAMEPGGVDEGLYNVFEYLKTRQLYFDDYDFHWSPLPHYQAVSYTHLTLPTTSPV